MTRRLRLRLLGDGWDTYGGFSIPADRIIELTEDEAAPFLRDRSSARSVEVLGWADDTDEEQSPPG